jgi:hypothetical protein
MFLASGNIDSRMRSNSHFTAFHDLYTDRDEFSSLHGNKFNFLVCEIVKIIDAMYVEEYS